MMRERIFRYLSRDMGIDLGTANTLVFVRGKGAVLDEPSVVAIRADTREPLAVGVEAKRMIGRTPGNIIAVRPMKDGVIADYEITQTMLRYFIGKAASRALLRPRVLVCVPSGVTEVEKRAVIDATLQAGAREAYLIEEPMAAAIGAGLPIHEPTGNMVVDIGGGTTEVAVISLGGIVTHRSVRVAGDEMDAAIVSYVKRKYNLLIGERTAEEVKIRIGSAVDTGASSTTMEVRGRDLVTGLPRTLDLTSEETRTAMSEPVTALLDALRVTLERTPPELASDIMDRGVVLTGGGALLRGLDRLISEQTGMPVHVAQDPMLCVVEGTGKVLEELDSLKRILATTGRARQ